MAETRKDPFLLALGERVRLLRARRGLTRKSVAIASGVAERHLANLEYGIGNASILVLQQVATALDCSLAELVGDLSTSSPEWLMLRELLRGRSDADLRRARPALATLFDVAGGDAARGCRLALIGLRGASIRDMHDLYGSAAYHRYERRALDETVRQHPAAVIATPGGIVAEPATFNALLGHCTTVWLQASPEEHMARVAAQGDTRPMAQSREAMADLRRILTGRTAFYAKADARFDTSGKSEDESFEGLLALVSGLLADGAPSASGQRRHPAGVDVKQTAPPA
jgi:XRE family aerobic/anaerobic benzoate catabolism transcriptional regulator